MADLNTFLNFRPGQSGIGIPRFPYTGFYPSDIRDIFIRMLQQDVFAQMDEGDCRWIDNEELTEIVIRDAGVIKADVLEKRPAILVTRSGLRWGNTSMGQRLFINDRDGTEIRTDLVAGQILFQCLSREGLEAEKVATVVFRALHYYRKFFQRAGIFKVSDDIDLGPETPAGAVVQDAQADTEYKMCTVTVPIFYQDSWIESDVTTPPTFQSVVFTNTLGMVLG